MLSMLMAAFSLLLVLVQLARCEDTFAAEWHRSTESLQYPADALASNPGDLYHMTEGLVPSPRVKSVMTYVDPLVVVMGGYNPEGTFLDDVHIYDSRLRKWSGVILKRRCCNHEGQTFEAMGAGGLDPDQDRGNYTAPGLHEGFEGDLPTPRAEHAACVAAGPDGDAHAHEPIGPPYSKTADSLVYVFGGLTAEYGVSNDFYTFDPINLQWNVIDRFGGQAPTRRAGHCLEPDRTTQKLYVFGGRGSTGVEATGTENSDIPLSDVWEYDIFKRQWHCVSCRGLDAHLARGSLESAWLQPAGRQHAAATLANSVLFVVGGICPQSHLVYSDAWAFHTASKHWQLLVPAGGGSNPQHRGYAPPPLYHAKLFHTYAHTDGDLRSDRSSDQSTSGSQTNTNTSSFADVNLVLYGGVGHGGGGGPRPFSFGAGNTYQQTSIGQVYRLPVSFGSYDVDSSSSPSSQGPSLNNGFDPFAGDGTSNSNQGGNPNAASAAYEQQAGSETQKYWLAAEGTGWRYVRLSDHSDGIPLEQDGAAGGGRGRLYKTWAMEDVAYDEKRGLLYELGGLLAQDIELTKANQPGARERAGPLAMDTGGMYGGGGDSTGVGDGSPSVGTAGSSNNADALAAVSAKTGTSLGGEAPLWDPHTGEHLRTTTQLPTNGPWVFQDAFTQSQPFVNGSLRFLHRMNTYVVIRAQTDTDVVLQTSDDKGFWSGSQGP